MEKKLRRYVSALSGLNEQISDKIHMHVRGNAILPEKMVSIDADMTSLNLLWPKNDKIANFPYSMVKFAFGQATNHENMEGANHT